MHEYLISLCSTYELHRFTLQCLEHGNTVEIHNGIMFDFYMGLPHMIYILIGNFCYEPNCNAKGELVLGAVGSVVFVWCMLLLQERFIESHSI